MKVRQSVPGRALSLNALLISRDSLLTRQPQTENQVRDLCADWDSFGIESPYRPDGTVRIGTNPRPIPPLLSSASRRISEIIAEAKMSPRPKARASSSSPTALTYRDADTSKRTQS